MTDADIGLLYKKDVTRLVQIMAGMSKNPTNDPKLLRMLMLLWRLDQLSDDVVGAISKGLSRPKELEGML